MIGKTGKRVAIAALVVLGALMALFCYWLANPIYEEDGFAVLAVRQSVREDGVPTLVTYYQNRTDKENRALVLFALYDKEGQNVGLAYGEQGPVKTQPGMIGKVVCAVVEYKNFHVTAGEVSTEEQIEDVDSWEVAKVTSAP